MAPQENLLNEDQFVISYEMLSLLQWLLHHEKAALQTIVKRAYTKGKEIITSTNQDQAHQAAFEEELRYGMVDFFDFLEDELHNAQEEQTHQKFMNSKLLKTLDHIDPTRFEQAMIYDTMQKTAAKLDTYQEPSQEQFLKELLKQWKPLEKNKKYIKN